MVMRGFKSFGEKTELVFNSNYNCVLGPNGSGKSNIGDALCFVLGKGSAKGMRAEKSSHLIYNGGKSKKPAKEGEVSIYFDNTNKIFPIDVEEIKITRIIRENGQSIYKINEQRKIRQEIVELLNTAMIDPDGHNIVLQGDIIRFIDMSGILRRQVIEEIAGIGIYEEKKQKALKELEKVGQKLTEAEIILAERRTYLKDLKKEHDHAAKYKELADKITRNKATYLDMRMQKKKSEREKLEKQIAEFEEKIKARDQTIAELKEKAMRKKQDIQRITKEVEEKGEKEQVEILRDVERLKADILSNKDRIGMCENEIQRVTTRKDQLTTSLGELDEKMCELQKRVKEQEHEKEGLTKEQIHIEGKVASFRKKNKLDGAEDIDKEITEIDAIIEEKQKELQIMREKQQELFREKDRADYQIHTVDERIAKVLELEKEHKAEIEVLKQMKQEFKRATLELNKMLQDDASISTQYAHARDKLQNAQDELAKLQVQQTRIREHSAGNIAVQRVLEHGSKLGAVHGLVSELGQVKSTYALALEIAAGNKIRSIVVEDDKTAANCIKYLKENKLGVATFLPMNKMKASIIDKQLCTLEKGNGVHGFATNLVSHDAKYKKVFNYIFGNTLVVDTIDVARRIGIGTIRMTTLDGDLIELSGAMQGGFRQKKKGSSGFQEKELTETIKDVEKIFMDNERIVRLLQEKRAELEKAIIRLREFKANLEGDIITKEKSLHLDSGDLEVSKKQKKELEEQSRKLGQNLDDIQKQISVFNKDFAQFKIRKQLLRDAIAQLRNPLLVAELNTFQQKKDEIKEKIVEIEANARNVKMQIENILVPEKENINKIVKQHEKEYMHFKEEIAQLKEKLKVQSIELQEKEKKQKDFYGAFRGLFKERDQLNEQLQKLENNIIVAEEAIRSVEQKKNVISIENARVGAEFAGMEEEFKQYIDVELYINKSEEALKKEIWGFERIVERLGNVNLKALEIYDQVEQEYGSLLHKKESLLKEKDQVFMMMNEIETKKKELFMKTFEVINKHFQEIFLALSTKGQAYLDIENEKDLFNAGVSIKVRITGKKFMDIRSLSGGEKTMTALALIFAIQEYDPAGFYIFDEVDAALDKVNSDKFAKLVRKYSGKAQYVIISHNDGVIAEADTLYGVSMTTDNMSKVVSLKI